MTQIEILTAVEEIKKLMAKRIRCMDLKNWEEYDTCHTDDATSNSYGEVPEHLRPAGGGIARGKGEILAMVRRIVDGPTKVTSIHHAHQPEIDILSSTEAKGVWVLEDQFWWMNGNVEESFHGFGHYHERYRRIDGRWFISARTVTRTRVTTTPNYYDYYSRPGN